MSERCLCFLEWNEKGTFLRVVWDSYWEKNKKKFCTGNRKGASQFLHTVYGLVEEIPGWIQMCPRATKNIMSYDTLKKKERNVFGMNRQA